MFRHAALSIVKMISEIILKMILKSLHCSDDSNFQIIDRNDFEFLFNYHPNMAILILRSLKFGDFAHLWIQRPSCQRLLQIRDLNF